MLKLAFPFLQQNLLRDLHFQIVKNGGPINRSRFGQIVKTLGRGEVTSQYEISALFSVFDKDKKGTVRDSDKIR